MAGVLSVRRGNMAGGRVVGASEATSPDNGGDVGEAAGEATSGSAAGVEAESVPGTAAWVGACLLYTSDAADDF